TAGCTTAGGTPCGWRRPRRPRRRRRGSGVRSPGDSSIGRRRCRRLNWRRVEARPRIRWRSFKPPCRSLQPLMRRRTTCARRRWLAQAGGYDAEWRPVRHLWKTASELLQDHPNLDFGLAAVTRTYRLPDHAPLVMFALGRTMGWIAHAMEEYATGRLIRPRAR